MPARSPFALPPLPTAETLVQDSRSRAAYHAQMASLLESLAGLCRNAYLPGEVAVIMLGTGQDAAKIDRQLDDMLCMVMLLLQLWQRELRSTAALQAAHPGVH